MNNIYYNQIMDLIQTHHTSFEDLLGIFILDHPENLAVYENMLDNPEEWKIELSDYIGVDFDTFLTDVRICLEAQI